MRPVGVRSFCFHENCPARMFLSYPKRVFLYTPLSLSTPAKEVTAKNLCSCRAGRNGNSTSAGKPQREGCLYMLKCSNAAILQLANSCFIKNQNCFPKALERQENPKQCCKCLIFIIWGWMDTIRNEIHAKIMVWWSKLQLITTIKNQSVCVLICTFSVRHPDSWTIILLRKKRNKWRYLKANCLAEQFFSWDLHDC